MFSGSAENLCVVVAVVLVGAVVYSIDNFSSAKNQGTSIESSNGYDVEYITVWLLDCDGAVAGVVHDNNNEDNNLIYIQSTSAKEPKNMIKMLKRLAITHNNILPQTH